MTTNTMKRVALLSPPKQEETVHELAQEDYFSKLPEELLFKIFRSLPKEQIRRCSEVCHRWRQIATHRSFRVWTRVYIRHAKVSLATVADLIKRGVRKMTLFVVTILDPGDNENPFDDSIESILRQLTMVRPRISPSSLGAIIGNSTKLIRLDISRCPLNQEICDAIGKNAELDLLLLNGCSGLDGPAISAILKGCRRICELGLCSAGLSSETLNDMIPHLSPSILRLDIRRCGPSALRDEHISGIVKACPRLYFLDIEGNMGLTENAYDLLERELPTGYHEFTIASSSEED